MSATTTEQPTEQLPAPPAETTPSNVIEAISAVMQEVRAVGKDGFNEAQRFNFRGIDAVMNAVGPAMRKHGLVCLPHVRHLHREVVEVGKARNQMQHVQVEVEYKFYGPSGVTDTISAVVSGEAMDSGDKATSKAMSVALRTALLQALALPTTEPDPDSSTYDRSPAFDVPAFMADVDRCIGTTDGPAAISALRALGNQHGLATLSQARCDLPTGEPTTGADLIRYWISQVEAAMHRAQVTNAQDAIAEQPPRTEESTRAPEVEQRAPAQPVDARPPAAVAAQEATAQQARTREERAVSASDAMLRNLREELEGQARILGRSTSDHLAPLLAGVGANKMSEVKPAKQRAWTLAQRPQVIAALREQGLASVAEHYQQFVAKNELAPWAMLVGEHAPDGVRARIEQPAS